RELAWRRHVTCSVDDHSLRTITPKQSAALRDPAIFMVPRGNSRTLQAAVVDSFLGGTCLDFSYPGAGLSFMRDHLIGHVFLEFPAFLGYQRPRP
ncbi:unnamed protein product, partial [Sphacelaria rigidula]